MQRCVNLHVSQHLLHLFYWHAFVYSHSCQCPAEFVRVNLVEVYTLSSWRKRTSTPLMVRRVCGSCRLTNNAGLVSVRCSKYFLRWILVPCVEINLTLFVALAKHSHWRSWKSMSSRLIFTNSPTRIPVLSSKSIIAMSRNSWQLSRNTSIFSSVSTSLSPKHPCAPYGSCGQDF